MRLLLQRRDSLEFLLPALIVPIELRLVAAKAECADGLTHVANHLCGRSGTVGEVTCASDPPTTERVAARRASEGATRQIRTQRACEWGSSGEGIDSRRNSRTGKTGLVVFYPGLLTRCSGEPSDGRRDLSVSSVPATLADVLFDLGEPVDGML